MGLEASHQELIDAARAGDKRATGRLISIVENDQAIAVHLLAAVYSNHDGWVTGLTGAPGSGKSTLADRLVAKWRDAGRRVAMLAVDPTSPFSGGALLGDRVRLQSAVGDEGVLVRSMATRGWLGGLARSTERVATLCGGLGYDEILIETVGVGQSEVDIAAAADTTIVVVTPGWGDGVQVAKAGVMEIADVFVINKADRDGADATARDITEMLEIASADPVPTVVRTVATTGEGTDALYAALEAHRALSETNRETTGARRLRALRQAVIEVISDRADERLGSPEGQRLQTSVIAGDIDPWSAATKLL